MSEPIDFYFDFSSPYGFLGSQRIDALAARYGREVTWRPYLMGAAMKISGSPPLVAQPLLAEYSRHDLERSARLIGVPFTLPEPFPVATVAACRAYYWLVAQDAMTARKLARALYAAYFTNGRNIGEPETVVEVGTEQGLDRDALQAGLQDPEVKARLRDETDTAIERGVFGAPFFIVDGEAFWGHDRLPHVEHWLKTGGW